MGKKKLSQPRKKTKKKVSRGFFLKSLKIFLTLGVWGFIFLGLIALWHLKDLPNVETVETASKRPGLVFLSAGHQEISINGDVSAEPLALTQIPQNLIDALIATEDRTFYQHKGIDWLGIVRAGVKNILAGRWAQGASTITQQLAKNLFLSPEKSLTRKFKELFLSLWLEYHFSKDQILTIYMNRVFLGRHTYGVEAAAQQYFGKSASRLTLVESAVIVALLKAPSRYGRNEDLLKKRAQVVLHCMLEEGKVSDKQYDRALKALEDIQFAIRRPEMNARYFTDWVEQEAAKHVDVFQDLIIVTTLDLPLQKKANAVFQEVKTQKDFRDKKVGQAAFVAMDHTGAVRAMLGGTSYQASQFNGATQARRQPGSVFKPLVYLAALEQGFDPETMLLSDEPYRNQKWTVNNFGWKSRGQVTMGDGLVYSINTATVRLAEKIGIGAVQKVAHKMGFRDASGYNLSTALGTSSCTLLELVTMMGIVANLGQKIEPYAITKIYTASGEVLYERKKRAAEKIQLFHREKMRLLEKLLGDVIAKGTGKRAGLDSFPVCGKTGTTQDFRDAWFIGYTPILVGGVWLGNADYTPMKRVVGGGLPAQLWARIFGAQKN